LLASVTYGLFYDRLGWRYMFMLGVIPAILVFFIRRGIDESPAWEERRIARGPGVLEVLRRDWKLAVYAIILMAAFNFFSHGSQDAYPNLFLKGEHHFDTRLTSLIVIVANIGAICGGLLFGSLSEKIGRRRAIIIATLIALPVLPFWAFGSTPLILGAAAFLMQVSVQGAWGVIPAHLNELSPPEIRATFPGFVYQLGNLLAARMAMAAVIGTVAVVITLLVALGPERRGVPMSASQERTHALALGGTLERSLAAGHPP